MDTKQGKPRGYSIKENDSYSQKLAINMATLKFPVGNVLPLAWYATILKPESKRNPGKQQADIIAMLVLSEIVYWYIPVVVDIEGKQVVRKKYFGNYLQKDYIEIANKMGLTRTVVYNAIRTLEELGVIERVYADLRYGSFTKHQALFIKLHFDVLKRLTMPEDVRVEELFENDENAPPYELVLPALSTDKAPIINSQDQPCELVVNTYITDKDYPTNITHTPQKREVSVVSDSELKDYFGEQLKQNELLDLWVMIKKEMDIRPDNKAEADRFITELKTLSTHKTKAISLAIKKLNSMGSCISSPAGLIKTTRFLSNEASYAAVEMALRNDRTLPAAKSRVKRINL